MKTYFATLNDRLRAEDKPPIEPHQPSAYLVQLREPPGPPQP